MLTIHSRVRIFAAVEPVDFRKGFDGLVQIVRDGFREDPFGGDLFCFFNRNRSGKHTPPRAPDHPDARSQASTLRMSRSTMLARCASTTGAHFAFQP